MDYRLTDPFLDPPDQIETNYSEESFQLPETYWCYRPPVAKSAHCQSAAAGFCTPDTSPWDV